MGRYTKALVQLVMTILAATVPYLASGDMDYHAWVNVGVIAAGVIMVYSSTNIPGWNYAKLVASAVAAIGVVLLSVASPGDIGAGEVIQMILAAGAALGVGALKNEPAPRHAQR